MNDEWRMMNGELREFYELGGSRLIIGELLELGMRECVSVLIVNGELWLVPGSKFQVPSSRFQVPGLRFNGELATPEGVMSTAEIN